MEALQGGGVYDVWSEWHRPGDPLWHRRGLVQLRQPEVPRLAGTYGGALHRGRPVLCAEGARAMVPGKVRHLAALPPDFPRFCAGRRPGALPRYLGDGHAQGDNRAVRDARLASVLTVEGTKESISFFIY